MDFIPITSSDELCERYDVLLLDAYGVLNDHDGALPGAPAFIAALNRRQKPYLLLTNDASRTPETSSRRFRGMGLDIAPDRIVTSGLMFPRYFSEHGLEGARCIVLGPAESREYVERAGGKPVRLDDGTDADALIVCDEAGMDYRPTLDLALSFLFRKLDAGQPVHLVLANPDVVYPAAPGRFGFTSGAMALLLAGGLAARYPGHEPRFVRLGKPSPFLFDTARQRFPDRTLVMIGDQLETDIRGARDSGLDSVLVGTGVVRLECLGPDASIRPTYVMGAL
jgi:HAD superfamily hydrolase (TIGR01450 family)